MARIIEQMKADADAAAEEESDDEEGMDLSQVQAKLGACSEPELKKMLKDMELPVKGNVRTPAPRPLHRPRHGLQQRTCSISPIPPQPHVSPWVQA